MHGTKLKVHKYKWLLTSSMLFLFFIISLNNTQNVRKTLKKIDIDWHHLKHIWCIAKNLVGISMWQNFESINHARKNSIWIDYLASGWCDEGRKKANFLFLATQYNIIFVAEKKSSNAVISETQACILKLPDLC